MSDRSGSGELDRRSFLKNLAGVGLGGAWLAGCSSQAAVSGAAAGAGALAPARDRIGVQLYTVRDQLARDFDGVLEQLAQIGYKELEFAGYYNRSPEQIRATLDRLGLRAPSTHVQLAQMRNDLQGVFATAKTIGHQYVVVPSLAEADRGGLAQWRQLASEFNRYGAAAREQGLRFGYHNHSFEFEAVGGGRTAMDVLIADTDPELVDFELDLFWTVNSERDPVELFTRAPRRFPLWHVKDMADRRGAKRMAPVGEGEIDFARIFANAGRSGMRHFFVEHDSAAQHPGGSLASVRTSYQNLKNLLG